MSRLRPFRSVGFSALIFALACGQGLTQEHPWSERAIPAHIDQKNLRGALPGPVFEALRQRGEELFVARFTAADGVGRPLATQASRPTKRTAPSANLFDRLSGPDASACAGCHNQPETGGAGDFAYNIFIVEDFSQGDRHSADPAVANERGTTHIFGAGLVELLAREMTAELHRIRENAVTTAMAERRQTSARLVTKGVDFGSVTVSAKGAVDTSRVEGVDSDLVIRPFGQKGVFVSLREFTVNVLNHHHGMQADERFGFAVTGELDFDGDGVNLEMSAGDVSALVAWQAGLKPPQQAVPEDDLWQTAARRGQQLFSDFGCATCHIPALPLSSLKFSDPGPIDAEGTLSANDVAEPAIYDLSLTEWADQLQRDQEGNVLVPLFGDLKRHVIADPGDILANEQLPQRGVSPTTFLTAELWGVASTAPYGHRNAMVTLDEIVRAHGGAARQAQRAYIDAAESDRQSLIAYLRSLTID